MVISVWFDIFGSMTTSTAWEVDAPKCAAAGYPRTRRVVRRAGLRARDELHISRDGRRGSGGHASLGYSHRSRSCCRDVTNCPQGRSRASCGVQSVLNEVCSIDRRHVFPDVDGYPSRSAQPRVRVAISALVCGELVAPPVCVRLRRRGVNWAGVPEAAVDIDRDSGPGKNQVGPAPQTG